jgi:hypothetical protein
MPWKTFKGFVTDEEMTMLVKHVEIPQRVSSTSSLPALSETKRILTFFSITVSLLKGVPPAPL